MTTMPLNTPPRPSMSDAYREIVGLVLLIAGVTALTTAGFLLSPIVGIATLGIAFTAAGAWLTFGEA